MARSGWNDASREFARRYGVTGRADGYKRASDGPDFFMVRQDIIHNERIARLPKAERWEFISLAAGIRKSGSEDYRLRAPVDVFKGLLGRSRRDLLEMTLRRWEEISLISFIDDREVFEIAVCNPSDLFRMTTPKRRNSVVTETETETETEKRKETRAAGAHSDKRSMPGSDLNEKNKRAKPTERSATDCPEELDDETRTRIALWAAKTLPRPVSPALLAFAWERVRAWALSKGLRRRNWEQTLRNAILSGWVFEGFNVERPGLSSAEAKVARTKDAARSAVEKIRRNGGELVRIGSTS